MAKLSVNESLDNADAPFKPGSAWFRGMNFIAAGVFFLLILISFPRILDQKMSLDASDAPMVWAHQFKSMITHGVFSNSNPYFGIGTSGLNVYGDFSIFFYLFLPEQKVDEALFASSVFFCAFFFYLFLRDRKCSFWAAIIGALVFGFSTSLLSIVKAGHLGKFVGLAYLSAALWLVNRGMLKDRWGSMLWAGWCLGCAAAWGRDITVIMMIPLGLFWVKETFSVKGLQPEAILKRAGYLGLVLLVAAIVAWPAASDLLPSSKDKAAVSVKEDPDKKWEWATQWSLPDDEVIKLICPSYFGWHSWDEKAPYWGRMGRSAEWEKKHQGFRNFTQTNEYIGIVAVILALIGAGSFIFRSEQNGSGDELISRIDTIFWVIVSLLAIDCALGKYGLLYRFVYELPIMSSIRNPVKFMHVINLALAVLAAKGVGAVEEVLRSQNRTLKFDALMALGAPVLFIIVFAGLAIAGEWNSSDLAERLSKDGFQQNIEGIKEAMQMGVARSLLFCITAAAVTFFCVFSRHQSWFKKARWAFASGILVLVTLDFASVNNTYVQYYDHSAIYKSNPVLEYVRGNLEYRTKFIPMSFPVFNQWNSLLVSYYGIRSVDVSAESRMASDKQAFYERFGNDPKRMWQILGVRYFVMPREIEPQLKSLLGEQCSTVRSFDFFRGPNGAPTPDFRVSPSQGNYVIDEFKGVLPVLKWYGQRECATLENALKTMSRPDFDLNRIVLLDDADVKDASLAEFGASGRNGTVNLEQYDANTIKGRSNADSDGWVMINDYYDTKWKAYVDGKSVPMVRADGLFRAVPVKAGSHEILLVYKGNVLIFWLLALSLSMLVAGTFGWHFMTKFKKVFIKAEEKP